VRVVICDDSALFRRGLALLLTDVGVDVLQATADVRHLTAVTAAERPDAVILDIRMPPSFTDEGLTAADQLRRAHPGLGVLVLSTYAETTYAMRLLQIGTGVGYLLKDRVDDARAVRDALERVVRGQTVVDPDIVTRLLTHRRNTDRLDRLTDRERDVLAHMAEGRSNAAIARRLRLAEKTVESHIATLLNKLDLEPTRDDNRRVLAVLAWLRGVPPGQSPQ
jgi:DNA-binding NarL/FixJ family response regulator